MEECNKIIILNKYLSDPEIYDKYFNSIFNIAYYIYKKINYNDVVIYGGSIYYMVYKRYQQNEKYFKYFQTLDIDMISVYPDLSCLYYHDMKRSIKNIIINDFKNILINDKIKHEFKTINKLLNNGKKDYEIKISFKYFNTTSIKVQVIYANSEISFTIIDFLITSQIRLETVEYKYKSKYFKGENLICSSINLLTPIGYFWQIISAEYYKNNELQPEDIYMLISNMLTHNPAVYNIYIKNFIRSMCIYNLVKFDREFRNNYIFDFQVIKSTIHILRSKFFKHILPEKITNCKILSRSIDPNLSLIDYYEFLIQVFRYLDKKILDHQKVNNDEYYHIDIHNETPMPIDLKKKFPSLSNNKPSLDKIIKNFQVNGDLDYIKDINDENHICYPKLKNAIEYL